VKGPMQLTDPTPFVIPSAALWREESASTVGENCSLRATFRMTIKLKTIAQFSVGSSAHG
jgi:hypothetical protein